MAAADARPVAPTAAPASRRLDDGPAASTAIPVAADASGVYLQLGAFSARQNAESFRARINGQLAWLNKAIEIFQRDGLFRLHLGPYRDRAEASSVAKRILDALDLKAMFVTR